MKSRAREPRSSSEDVAKRPHESARSIAAILRTRKQLELAELLQKLAGCPIRQRSKFEQKLRCPDHDFRLTIAQSEYRCTVHKCGLVIPKASIATPKPKRRQRNGKTVREQENLATSGKTSGRRRFGIPEIQVPKGTINLKRREIATAGIHDAGSAGKSRSHKGSPVPRGWNRGELSKEVSAMLRKSVAENVE
jgi:hypothetical protein